jgi:divalent metal cation (Fe/Co/Zn/Cd) transporter
MNVAGPVRHPRTLLASAHWRDYTRALAIAMICSAPNFKFYGSLESSFSFILRASVAGEMHREPSALLPKSSFGGIVKPKMTITTDRLYQWAFWLSVCTVGANVLEGAVSMYLGLQEGTLALFGFGVDSGIEVISALGISWMILRMRQNPDSPQSAFENSALRITGGAMYALAAGLVAGAVFTIASGRKPDTAVGGLAVSLVSLSVMWALVYAKRVVGRRLCSAPILADANCTMVCIYMSLILLASSALFAFTGIGWLDGLGAAGLAWFSFREGRESFAKAAGRECDCMEKE